jgi:hypothetical protein
MLDNIPNTALNANHNQAAALTNTETHSAGLFMHLIAASLTPMFLPITNGDPDQARAAAIETINAHAPRTPADLLPIAQIIAFGLAALSSISLSVAEDIPNPLILRLRGNAASLNRGAQLCRRALRETAPHDAAPAEQSEAERRVEQAVITEIARTHQRIANEATQPAIPPDHPPTMAAALDVLAAESQRRIDEAEAALKAPSRRPRPVTEDQAHRTAWSNAMADVAREVAAEIDGLPPIERRAAGLRAAALTSAANHLLTGGPTPSPLIFKTSAA